MKTDRERATVIMRKEKGRLAPASAFDAEILDALADGVDVEVTLKQRRSLPQMRAYWAMLADVVAATDAYPSAEHMHDALKYAMGYTQQITLPDGRKVFIPDSVAFGRMGAAEFKGFFDRATRFIAETYGIDPMALTRKAA